jgi:hypothetical protein
MGADNVKYADGKFAKAVFIKGGSGNPMVFKATVTTYTDTTHFKTTNLTGYGDDYFGGPNNNWYVYAVRDDGGAGALPQGESELISDYVSSDGTFTHVAFTTPLAVGDEILIVHAWAKPAAGGDATAANQTLLLADIGDASASTLLSLYGILGNPSASLATTILDGIDARANNANLNALLGVADAAGKSINGNIGDFQAQTNLQTLLASLGIPDTAAKPLYTCLVTDRLDHATHGLSALDTDLDTIIASTQIRRVASGIKAINSAATKYLSIDSGTNGAEIIGIAIKGVVSADWTLDVYVPTADAVAAPAAGDKRDTNAYVNTDAEGGMLSGFAIPYNCFLDFTNDSAGADNIDDVVILYRSSAVLTLAWEA